MRKRIYCADVTKLIAADSFLSTRPFRDPEAADAFSDLTTVLCNPFDVYFFRRVHLAADYLGPVAKCWIETASADANAAVSPGVPSPASIVMNDRYADFFATFYKGAYATQAVQFTLFQSSVPELMRVFWSDNYEEDLESSYKSLAGPTRSLMPLRAAIGNVAPRLNIVQASNRALAELGHQSLQAQWNDELLAIAYLAWSYIKGFRYVSSLTPQHTYAVHFTRQHVFDPRSPWMRHQAASELKSWFPWGVLLRRMTGDSPQLSEGYGEAVKSLRAFTRAQLPSYESYLGGLKHCFAAPHSYDAKVAFRQAFKRSRDFAIAGLSATQLGINNDLLEEAQRDVRYLNYLIAVLFAGAGLMGSEWSEVVRLYIETVLLATTLEDRAARSIALLKSKSRARSVVTSEEKAVRDFLAARAIHKGLY